MLYISRSHGLSIAQLHSVVQEGKQGCADVIHCQTLAQKADVYTKACISGPAWQRQCDKINVMPEDRLFDMLRSQAIANATAAIDISDDEASQQSPEMAALCRVQPTDHGHIAHEEPTHVNVIAADDYLPDAGGVS